MVEIKPFRGVRYDPAVVDDISGVLCPPASEISAKLAQVLQDRSSYNAVRLEWKELQLGDRGESGPRSPVAARLGEWIARGALCRETVLAVYVIEESFRFRGRDRTRVGMVVALKLEDFGSGSVYPHENTESETIASKLRVLSATSHNLSPIMGLYDDPTAEAARLIESARCKVPTVQTGTEAGAGYRMWAVTDPDFGARMSRVMAGVDVYLADGHHRYEGALRMRDSLEASRGSLTEDDSAAYIMAALYPADGPGIFVLPHHRVLETLRAGHLDSISQSLEELYELEVMTRAVLAPEELASVIEDQFAEESPESLGMVAVGLEPSTAHLLRRKATSPAATGGSLLESCEAWVLHNKVFTEAHNPVDPLPAARYEQDMDAAVRAAMGEPGCVALLLRPVPMSMFTEVVGSGERLPAKTTRFHPKPPTGLVMSDIGDTL